MGKGVLILSGYNIRAVVAFCRWARIHLIPFHLIARDASDPIFLTAFRKDVFLTREDSSLTKEKLCDWINSLRAQYSYEKVLLLPSSEFFNRFALNNRALIESRGGLIPLVDKELYERISDKYSFGEICSKHNIPVPKEFSKLPNYFPFVAKPRSYCSISERQLKPYLIHRPSDLERFKKCESEADFYFQQYVEGKSIYLLASIPKNGAPVIFSQENLIQQENGGSIVLARENEFYNSKVAESYLRLLDELNFRGLMMIEVRYQAESNKFFMIEANPRLWGPIQLTLDCGVDVFHSLLVDYGFNVVSRISRREHGKFYFWSGGLFCGAKPDFHNYSSDQFVNDFSLISRDNLFLRMDTIDLYHHELNQSSGAT